jgi:outer membrane protein assembly factor BamB
LPISLGGPVDSRSPIIDGPDSSLAENVIYVADNDGLVYAVATDTGQVVWVVNPTGVTTTNNFVGS